MSLRAKNETSKYVGVSWDRVLSKWKSGFTYKGVRYECGFYTDERQAAKARDLRIISLGIPKPLQILKRIQK